jgi:FAD/FMN-containing dehydrogenase
VSELAEIVGASHVLVDPDLRAPYETDWTGRFTGRAAASCGPRPPARWPRSSAPARRPARDRRAGRQHRPGRRGRAGRRRGAAQPRPAARPGPGRPARSQVTAGAGVTLEKLQEHARAAGLDFGVDLAARSAATVGGLVATNAGGSGSCATAACAPGHRYRGGLADGTVVSRLTGLAKDNTGYDLPQLLCGSEGTLAVVTRVRLRLVPLLTARTVALVAVAGTEAALDLLAAPATGSRALRRGDLLRRRPCMVRAHAASPPRSPTTPGVRRAGVRGRADPTDDVLEMLSGCDAVADATVASDAAGRARLWAYRETHTEAINAAGVPVKLDVSVPLAEFPAWSRGCRRPCAGVAPGARTVLFGHVNEGNVHVNVLDAGDRAEAVSDAVLTLVAAHRGQHQLRARRGPGQGALAGAVAVGGGDRRHAADQGRPRPGRPAQPGCAAAAQLSPRVIDAIARSEPVPGRK